MATEWIVEARAGGKCIVRVVHSLFTDKDDWDDQLEMIEGGWPDYFEILRLYLTHFRGQPCSGMQLMGMAAEAAAEVWGKLATALGLAEARVGERRESPAGAPRMAGLVERTGERGHAHQVLLRLDVPAPGLAHLFAMEMGGTVIISVRFYLYGAEAAGVVAREEPVWQQWMKEKFRY
jgi:hypothetical protein